MIFLFSLFCSTSFALISSGDFKNLSVTQQTGYILEIRKFLVQQEQKQLHFHNEFAFQIFNEAVAEGLRLIVPNENGACTSDEDFKKLSLALQSLVNEKRDRCVVAGNTVCMATTSRNRLSCRLSEMPGTSEQLRGDCKTGEIECAFPIFMNKSDGGKICHKERTGLTEICDQESRSASEVAEALRTNSSLDQAFKKLIGGVESYCGKTAGSKVINRFDQSDCHHLYQRLALKNSSEHITNCKVRATEFISAFNFKEVKDGALSYREISVLPRANGGTWVLGQIGQKLVEMQPSAPTKVDDIKTRLVMTNAAHEDGGEVLFDQTEPCTFSVLKSANGTYNPTKKECTIGGLSIAIDGPSKDRLKIFPEMAGREQKIEFKTLNSACIAIGTIVHKGEIENGATPVDPSSRSTK